MGSASSKKSRPYKTLEQKYRDQLDLNIKASERLEQFKRNYNALLGLLLSTLSMQEGHTLTITPEAQNYPADCRLDISQDAKAGTVVLSLIQPTVQPVSDDGTDPNEPGQPESEPES